LRVAWVNPAVIDHYLLISDDTVLQFVNPGLKRELEFMDHPGRI
jgi:hypothetical protein